MKGSAVLGGVIVVALLSGVVWYVRSLPTSGLVTEDLAVCDINAPISEGIEAGPDGYSGGSSVPALQLNDFKGNSVDLVNDYYGRPVVINSWAAWCPFCVEELPAFGAVKQVFGDEVGFVAIDRAESKEIAQKFAQDSGVIDDLTFLLDPNDDFYSGIGGFAMPETLFVRSDGTVQFHKRGPMIAGEICDRVKLLIRDK